MQIVKEVLEGCPEILCVFIGAGGYLLGMWMCWRGKEGGSNVGGGGGGGGGS